MAHPNQPSSALVPTADNQTAAVSLRETASTAVAAREKASVEARFLVAMRQPRNVDRARLAILAACRRPRFAEGAKYAKPVGGKKIVGPSIRFVEEGMRAWGNIDMQTQIIFDDDERRIVKVIGVDLETNLSYPFDVIVEKTVERLQPKNTDEIIRTRTNSRGQTVAIIRADEDAFLNKCNAAISKAVRNVGLRLLPSDIVEEAMETVDAVIADDNAKDPTAARKRLVDAFFRVGVSPEGIAEFLGHSLDLTTAAELQMMGEIYTALKDGEAKWSDFIAERRGEGKGKDGVAGKSGTEALRAVLEKKAETRREKEESEEEIRRQDAALLAEEGA